MLISAYFAVCFRSCVQRGKNLRDERRLVIMRAKTKCACLLANKLRKDKIYSLTKPGYALENVYRVKKGAIFSHQHHVSKTGVTELIRAANVFGIPNGKGCS